MRYLSSLLFLWICLIGCDLIAAGAPASALPDQITPTATNFLAASISISPAAILDAEKYLLHAETVVKLSDSLWLTVQAMADTQNTEAIDTGHLTKLVNQGLKTLGENLKWLPEVRRIERHLSEISSSDYQFIIRALYQQAIYDYFDAKEKNPYNNQVGAAIFHKLLTKFWRERHVSAEVIDAFWEKSQSTKWLESEKYDYYLLIGAIHHYFRRWPDALTAYTQAYELNTRHAYPPGIDSSFAARQDSIASKAMISSERKLIAQIIMEDAMEIKVIHDSLRFYNNYFLDPLNVFTYADSQMARRFFDRALTLIDMDDRFLQKRIKKAILRKYNLIPEDLGFIADQLFPIIERKFLKAKEFDPFNWSHRYRLARLLYYNLAEVTGDSTYYAKSAAEFENLIWIQKGNWGYYLYLGDAYMGMQAWEPAYQNYHQAEIVLVNTALLNQSDPQIFFARPDSSPVEPNWLALCINHQAEAKIKMLEGKTALDLLRRAATITTDEKMRAQLNLRIEDVNWDEGNVVAMNLRHQAIAQNREGNYEAAKAIYLQLLTLLWTQKTRDEINSQIAIYDFQYLDQKEAGIERMRQVVSPIAKDENDEAVNTENNVYLRHYGRMCYELGLKYLQQEEDRKLAYIYFAQSTQIKWYGRPKAFLQLADLSNFDPRETIRLCNTALAEPESLSPGDKRQLAELLSKSFQKQANFIEAKTWHRRSLDKQWCENRTSY